MRAKKRKVSLSTIEWSTNRSKEAAASTIERAERFQKDAEKVKRLSECKCKSCFYLFHSRIGGASITTVACGVCDTDKTFGSTAVNPVCDDCGKSNGICVQCGGDIDIKLRRKPYPFMVNKDLK